MSTVLGMPRALIALGVMFVVGLVVIGQLATVADGYDLGTTGNATRTTLFANIYRGFDLGTLAPIVIAAVSIMVVISYLRSS